MPQGRLMDWPCFLLESPMSTPPEQALDHQHPDWWNQRYANRDTPWDLGNPTPILESLLTAMGLKAGPGLQSALIVGAGRGHDARLLAERGFEVLVVDFAPLALQAASDNLQGLSVKFLEADLFELPRLLAGQTVDVLVEHTCFCAIDPSRRNDYARVASELVRPGGLLVGVFFEFERPTGPPFGGHRQEYRETFSPYFEIQRLELASVGHEKRAASPELEALFVRKS